MSLVASLQLTGQRLAAVGRSGVLTARPDILVRIGLETKRRGPVAGACVGAAIRWGDRELFADEFGSLTARQLDERSNAIAHALIADGVRPGDGAAILCRNHRGFLDATFGAMKAGMRCVFLNTEFAGPQIDDVCKREQIDTLLFDNEYADRAPAWAKRHFCTLAEDGDQPAVRTTEQLIATGDTSPVDAPSQLPKMVILTSGTTGTPKGAPRDEVKTLDGLGALLERVPLRTQECTYVAPPFFHALGFAHLLLGLSLGSKVVSRRRFTPETMLADIARHRATAAIVVPAMLQRALELGKDELRTYDTSALRVIFCSGSQLPGQVATEVLDAFGDVLYVLYGSTEVAYATMSTPADHRAAPNTVGRPCLGVGVRLLDDDGRPVAPGQTGRIFIQSGTAFGGYTDGSNKEIIDGAMSSGDVGHFDAAGRLFIDGRDDDMIVSGGENVFPMEVEELLIKRDDIAEVSVVGVDDETFGKRLVAFVVTMPGTAPTEDELKSYVKENLARYKVPREVHFLDELPRNATGKILKRQLLASLAER